MAGPGFDASPILTPLTGQWLVPATPPFPPEAGAAPFCWRARPMRQQAAHLLGRAWGSPPSRPKKLQNLGNPPTGRTPGRHGALAPLARAGSPPAATCGLSLEPARRWARLRRRGRVTGLVPGLLGAVLIALPGGAGPQGVRRRTVPLGRALPSTGVVLAPGLRARLVPLVISPVLALCAFALLALAPALLALGTRATSSPLVAVRLPPPIIRRIHPATPVGVVSLGRSLILNAHLPLAPRLLRVPASGPPPALLAALALLAGPRLVVIGVAAATVPTTARAAAAAAAAAAVGTPAVLAPPLCLARAGTALTPTPRGLLAGHRDPAPVAVVHTRGSAPA